MTDIDLLHKAREYSVRAHAHANQEYDGYPYELHLDIVEGIADYLTINYPDDRRIRIKAGARCHDIIEDARQSYNDVKKALGEDVAEIARVLCVDPRGRTRENRHTDEYYLAISQHSDAAIIKAADRLANIIWSKHKKSRMFERYRKEHVHFLKMLDNSLPPRTIQHLINETTNSEIHPALLYIMQQAERRYFKGSRMQRLEHRVHLVLKNEQENLDEISKKALTECLEIISEMRPL